MLPTTIKQAIVFCPPNQTFNLSSFHLSRLATQEEKTKNLFKKAIKLFLAENIRRKQQIMKLFTLTIMVQTMLSFWPPSPRYRTRSRMMRGNPRP